MCEKIAIVNDNDEVIGKEDRKEVHRKGLLHREAYLFIFNQENKNQVVDGDSDLPAFCQLDYALGSFGCKIGDY